MTEDSAAVMVEMAGDSETEMEGDLAEDSVEGMGQPKYSQSYRTNSPDRRSRTCISLGTQSRRQTYQLAPSLPPFQSTRKCLG